jgi:hypothetical protein
MSPQTKKYLHALEFAAMGAAIPVLNQWLITTTPLDWHTVVKSLLGAALTGAYTYFRMNPPPVDPTTPTQPSP